MAWPAHGEWRVATHGTVLVYEATGAWNVEAAIGFGEDATVLARTLRGAPWAVLGLVDHWELGTADSIEPVRAVGQKAMASGCEAMVLVVGEDPLRLSVLEAAVPSAMNGVPAELVTTRAIGLRFLAEQGFDVRGLADGGLEMALAAGRGGPA